MCISDAVAEYLLILVEDRIAELEERFKVAVTVQEEREIRFEIDRAKAISSTLRR